MTRQPLCRPENNTFHLYLSPWPFSRVWHWQREYPPNQPVLRLHVRTLRLEALCSEGQSEPLRTCLSHVRSAESPTKHDIKRLHSEESGSTKTGGLSMVKVMRGADKMYMKCQPTSLQNNVTMLGQKSRHCVLSLNHAWQML